MTSSFFSRSLQYEYHPEHRGQRVLQLRELPLDRDHHAKLAQLLLVAHWTLTGRLDIGDRDAVEKGATQDPQRLLA